MRPVHIGRFVDTRLTVAMGDDMLAGLSYGVVSRLLQDMDCEAALPQN